MLPLRGTGNKAIPLRQLMIRLFNTNIPPGLKLSVLLFVYHVNGGTFSTAWVSWLACTSILNAPVLYNPFPTFPDWMEEGEYFSGMPSSPAVELPASHAQFQQECAKDGPLPRSLALFWAKEWMAFQVACWPCFKYALQSGLVVLDTLVKAWIFIFSKHGF